MNEYRLSRDAGADLMELFLYGLDTFGLAQAEHYRDSMTRHVIFYDEQPNGVLITAIVHERSVRKLLRS